MKIIMHNPWGTADSSTYDCSLCNALHKKNIYITLFTNWHYEYDKLSDFKVSKIFFKHSEKMRRTLFRKLIRGWEYCETMLYLLNKYSHESPDVIHIQWLLFYRFDYLWIKMLRYILRKKNTKIILTAHNILPHVNGYKYKGILKKIYSNFDGIIVHSEVLKKQMIDIFGIITMNRPICVTSIGVEDILLEKVNRDTLRRFRNEINLYKNNGRNFLFAGVIHKNKGLDLLLESWREHFKKYPGDKLFIVGKVSYEMSHELNLIKKYQPSIRTSFGYKSDEEILAHFLECDIVVLPYREASQSGVLMIALSLGKPVITTNVGGLPEVVHKVNGGYIIHPNNPNILCETMDKASKISIDDLSKWNKEIRKQTLRHYSWENIANKTVNFYNETQQYHTERLEE